MEAMALIHEAFEDNRTVEPLDDSMHLFQTDDGEIIYLDIIINEFTLGDLLRNVELAEELYEKHNCKINLYLITHKEVAVKEFPINSEADFSIRIAQFNFNPYNMVLDVIKTKMETGEALSDEDLEALSIIPLVCPVEDRHEIRMEVFKIMNEIQKMNDGSE